MSCDMKHTLEDHDRTAYRFKQTPICDFKTNSEGNTKVQAMNGGTKPGHRTGTRLEVWRSAMHGV